MGDNTGEMGDNLPSIDLGTGRTATAIAVGQTHTCAILDNSSVKCWGENYRGQLGIDASIIDNRGDASGEMVDLPVVKLGTGRTATAISAGYGHNCVILDNSSVKCWGYGGSGQLVIDSNTNFGGSQYGDMADIPVVKLGTGRTATAINAGAFHTCAKLDNSSVKCWGGNSRGQLGIGNTDNTGNAAGEMDSLLGIDLQQMFTD